MTSIMKRKEESLSIAGERDINSDLAYFSAEKRLSKDTKSENGVDSPFEVRKDDHEIKND